MKAFATVIGIIGIALVWYSSTGYTAIGLFLALWGNNLAAGLARKAKPETTGE